MRTARIARLALLAGSLVVSLAVAELAARWWVPDTPSIRFTQNEEMLGRMGRQQAASVIEDDPELFWRLVPGLRLPEDAFPIRGIVANAQGLREDHEVAVPKPAGEIRLLFLGDSCTFGSGLLHDEGFVQRTEELLRARFPDVPIEAVNAGVPGYSLFQGWRFLETRGYDFEPDLVVVNFGWNGNTAWDGASDREHYAAWRAARPPAALGWSRLARLAWSAAAPQGDAGDADRTRLNPEEFRSLLEAIHASTREHGVDLLIVVWPAPFNIDPAKNAKLRTKLQGQMYRYGERLEFEADRARLVDLVPVARHLASRHDPSEIFLDHIHGTGLANRAYAQAIVQKIDPWMRRRVSAR